MLWSELEDEKIYYIEILDLRIAGKYLKSPAWQKSLSEDIRSILRKKQWEIDHGWRCYPDSRNTQVYQWDDDPPGFWIEPDFQGLNPLLSALDLPKDKTYYSKLFKGVPFFLLGNQKNNFEEYTFEVFGLRIDPPDPAECVQLMCQPIPDTSQFKWPPRYWYVDYFCLVEVRRIRIFPCLPDDLHMSPTRPFSSLEPCMMHFEEAWYPFCHEPYLKMGLGLKYNYRGTEGQKLINDGLQILGHKKRRGREAGPAYFQDRDSFVKKLSNVYSDLASRNAKRPSRIEVAQELNLATSTLRNYINFHKAAWPPPDPEG